MRLFDTHAHLDDPQLADATATIVERAVEAGVQTIVAIGTTVDSSQRCVEIAVEFDNVYAAVGIHPNHCLRASDEQWQQIRRLVRLPSVVAVGETGLDRHWDDCPFDLQQQWFARHIELSFETGLPLVIHMRECETDILLTLQEHCQNNSINGIMHSFTGCWETAKVCLELGMYVSFAGMLTFKNSADLRAIAARIPDDRLLIETDSPYLTPHPFRGRRPNEPALLRHTAECLAEIRQINTEQLGRITTDNARRVFQLDRLADKPARIRSKTSS